MTIDELLQERRIHRQKVAAADIEALIARAETDIESARFMLARDHASHAAFGDLRFCSRLKANMRYQWMLSLQRWKVHVCREYAVAISVGFR